MVWRSQVDEDFAAAEFRLQYRRSGSGGSQYEEAFKGRDSEFLVLHLDPHTDYLFRVCARGEGRTEWSPWSIPQTGYTTLAPHGTSTAMPPPEGGRRNVSPSCTLSEWRSGTEGYILSSRKNIALRNDSAHSRCPVLYSSGPTYYCGQTLTFRYARRAPALQVDRLSSFGLFAGSWRRVRWIGGTALACPLMARRRRSRCRGTAPSASPPTVSSSQPIRADLGRNGTLDKPRQERRGGAPAILKIILKLFKT